MNAKWIFKDGDKAVDCTSFPFAYRTMWNTLKKGVESKARTYEGMIKGFLIISPAKDRLGNQRTYSYAAATQMAMDQGLLTADGQINSREFKKL
jgi:hypothetical protein